MTCVSCEGMGTVCFTVPPGVRYSFNQEEVLAMKAIGPCQTVSTSTKNRGQQRKARFQPKQSSWPAPPNGCEYAHLCHDKCCGVPEHFVLTSKSINIAMDAGMFKSARGGTATEYACQHPRTPENTTTSRSKIGVVTRSCLLCNREKNRKYMARKRAERNT